MVPATSWQLIASCIPHSRNVAENLRENRETPQTAPEEKKSIKHHPTISPLRPLRNWWLKWMKSSLAN
jgi:hypothetical protein